WGLGSDVLVNPERVQLIGGTHFIPRHRHHPTAGRLTMLRKIASRNARKWATELPRGFESLEDRRLMTVSWALSNGVLTINGGNDTDDAVKCSIDTRGTSSTSDDLFVLNID